MSFRPITKKEFDGLGLLDGCRALWSRTEETEWYADASGATLGVILLNNETGYWGYVMCAKDASGEFARRGVGSDFTSVAMARTDLAASMGRHHGALGGAGDRGANSA